MAGCSNSLQQIDYLLVFTVIAWDGSFYGLTDDVLAREQKQQSGLQISIRSYLLSKSVRYFAYSRKLTAEMDEVLNEPPPKSGHT